MKLCPKPERLIFLTFINLLNLFKEKLIFFNMFGRRSTVLLWRSENLSGKEVTIRSIN